MPAEGVRRTLKAEGSRLKAVPDGCDGVHTSNDEEIKRQQTCELMAPRECKMEEEHREVPLQCRPKRPPIWAGFAGSDLMGLGTFFGHGFPTWGVDRSCAPGHTSGPPQPNSLGDILRSLLRLDHFLRQPNFIHFVAATIIYLLFPYDFETAALSGWTAAWVARRITLNVVLMWGYYGFCFLSLFKWSWATRKFAPTKWPTRSRLFHNIWFATTGAVQWSLWELVFVKLWSTGRLSYVADGVLWIDRCQAVLFLAGVVLVPVVRPLHFYFAHRLLHFRCLFKFVHKLHHRNTDPEPFAGLTMHPIEHLLYFSNPALISLVFHCHPFLFLWTGIHSLISPAMAHSGWEDHFQGDQFHYLHHARFECNYGFGCFGLDKLFGTFRDKLSGGGIEKASERAAAIANAKAAAELVPLFSSSPSQVLKDIIPDSTGSCLYWLLAVFAPCAMLYSGLAADLLSANSIATAIAFGPIFWGLLLNFILGDSFHFLWPFEKEKLVGRAGFHILAELALVIWPVWATTELYFR